MSNTDEVQASLLCYLMLCPPTVGQIKHRQVFISALGLSWMWFDHPSYSQVQPNEARGGACENHVNALSGSSLKEDLTNIHECVHGNVFSRLHAGVNLMKQWSLKCVRLHSDQSGIMTKPIFPFILCLGNVLRLQRRGPQGFQKKQTNKQNRVASVLQRVKADHIWRNTIT